VGASAQILHFELQAIPRIILLPYPSQARLYLWQWRFLFERTVLVRIFLLSFLFLLTSSTRGWATTRADSLLAALNQALAQRPHYEAQRLHRIDSLKLAYAARTGAPAAQFQLGLRIYDEYKAYKYDSAFAYCQRISHLASQLGDPGYVATAKLKLAFILLSSSGDPLHLAQG
jgi:hypothetical protein